MMAFIADWCPSCNDMKPDLFEFKYKEGYEVSIYDVSKDKDLAKEKFVFTVPSFLMIVEDKEYCRMTGKRKSQDLEDFYNHECN